MINKIINPINKKASKVNLAWFVGLIILISVVMVLVSLYVFYNSSAYNTVKEIRLANQQLSQDDLQDYDTKSPIQASDLEDYANSIQLRIKQFNDQEDFSQELVDPSQLGL